MDKAIKYQAAAANCEALGLWGLAKVFNKLAVQALKAAL